MKIPLFSHFILNKCLYNLIRYVLGKGKRVNLTKGGFGLESKVTPCTWFITALEQIVISSLCLVYSNQIRVVGVSVSNLRQQSQQYCHPDNSALQPGALGLNLGKPMWWCSLGCNILLKGLNVIQCKNLRLFNHYLYFSWADWDYIMIGKIL